ncbi:MAG: OsmC family protein [Chlorobi bacterium]|jgi:organic hydroperoxide reductase OsmC/OhrA|nr:OsmC family protein [Chlorobiota bacterium]
MPHNYTATINWERNGAAFAEHRYSRGHEWRFDGGVTVPASSSPDSVPLPFSVANAVDPEEALVAATASCHMLWFLWLAAQRGFVVESYQDEAYGIMEENPEGKVAFSRITLRPRIQFQHPQPTAQELEHLHHAAHESCYIANTLRCAVEVEFPPPPQA